MQNHIKKKFKRKSVTYRKLMMILVSLVVLLGGSILPTMAAYIPGVPPEVDPGIPVFRGDEIPVPPEPIPYDPAVSMLQAIFDADMAAGGESYWVDRVLERGMGGAAQNFPYTRGRALYMRNHTPGTLGFAGGYAWRERPTGGNQHMYTITISGATLSEQTAQRANYPSHWSSLHTATNLRIDQNKFITHNNVAVTLLTITNTGTSTTNRTITVASPIAQVASGDGMELTGSVTARYELTTLYPRLSGEGFSVSGSNLSRSVSIPPGESVTVKVQMGVTTLELPESTADYERYRDYDANTAFRTQLSEYNQLWVDTVPYIDIPDQNVKKMSYYRTFLNFFNHFDGNIPGNDYQFPVSIEGVLGYNNAIQLTQPMHLQDMKYFRDPYYAYGIWVSSGETSKAHAFEDNPGGHSWGNTYEQYIAREAWESIKIHGGDPGILENFAFYAEMDAKGQMDKYITNGNYLIEYQHGYLTGNDFDATPFVWAHRTQGNAANRQDRTEAAFQYKGLVAAAEAYAILGDDAKAAELSALADNILNDIMTLLWDDSSVEQGGHVFKHRIASDGRLIPWKDQQNFIPFMERIVPTDDLSYREAFRFFADAAEFPIMPFYTANQADKAEAAAMGRGGSNNFSNINSTLQAQTFSAGLKEYPSEYITQDMYRLLLEWLTWVQYEDRGNNLLPNNNEYFSNWNPVTQSFGRMSIYHNILGAFNFMIIEDIMGVTPRLDDVIELWPIDVGYDYFTINNLRYHGKDYTIVWQRPGIEPHYGDAVPVGYSVYLDGQRVFTVDDLAHVSWNSNTGEVTILDGSDTNVTFNIAMPLAEAPEISYADNPKIVDMFQKAGRDLTEETGSAVNLALGSSVSASFTTTSPAIRRTDPQHAVSGFTVSGKPSFAGGNNFSRSGWSARNTIWGSEGSPNAQDWYEIDFGEPTTFDTIKLYFYNDKNYGTQQNCSSTSCGNAYREPMHYTIQIFDGANWTRVYEQHKTPLRPQANYNLVQFNGVTAQRMRVLMTPTPNFGIGLKEIQVFHYGVELPPMVNQPPEVFASVDSAFNYPLRARVIGTIIDDELIYEFPEVTWTYKEGPGSVAFEDPHASATVVLFSQPGTYVLTVTAFDGEFYASDDVQVVVGSELNLAYFASPSTSFVSSWESIFCMNNGYEPTSSTDKGPCAYGNWNASGSTQWVQYTWDEPIVIDRSAVYWWTDGGGIQMPTASSLSYWTGSSWAPVPNGVGFGVLPNRYNVTTFDPIKTDRLRMTITRGSQWTGILEWKVFQAEIESIEPVTVTTLENNLPVLPTHLTAYFANDLTMVKQVFWNEVPFDLVRIPESTFEVIGVVDISLVPATASVYVEPFMDVSVDVDYQSVQYTDLIEPVTITAVDNYDDVPFLTAINEWSSDGINFQPGLPAGLSLDVEPCVIDGDYGACFWKISGHIWEQAGEYIIRTVISDEHISRSIDTIFEVTQEDAFLIYTGNAIAEVNTDLNLRVTVYDSAASGYAGINPEVGSEASIGDITKMWVAFDIYTENSDMMGAPMTTIYAQVEDTGVVGDGIGTASAVYVTHSTGNYYVVPRLVAGESGGENLWYAAEVDYNIVVFYERSNQMATGGGWVQSPDGRGNFGITARYLPNGRTQGNALFVTEGTYLGEEVKIIIKSNAMDALAFDSAEYPIAATLQGKANIKIVSVADDIELFSQGNATFQATVLDGGDTGEVDAFAVIVYTRDGQIFLSIPLSPLEGGQITIHNK